MGVEIAAVSEKDTVDRVLTALAGGAGGWLCTANLDILRQCRRSEELRGLVAGADFVVADGMPLVWAGRALGSRLRERVPGSTLIVSLTAAACDAGRSVFLLGGNPGTADAAAAELTRRNPSLRVCGTLCPPFGFEQEPEWVDRIEQTLVAAAPDIAFVGLGFPKQERLIVSLLQRMPATWFVPCGISFSFLAGEVRRAPVVLQRLGLEWLHRLAQEPRRLCRRYLLQDIPFLVEMLYWVALRPLTSSTRSTHASRQNG
jgi:N-acetylglucosaminyldiphosphoundecaprenol N-acetyl-beta-D-mannosaminyltransferase